MSRLKRDGTAERETKFSGTYGDRGKFIFPVQLTTNRIGNLTRLIHTLLYVMTIHIIYTMHIYARSGAISPGGFRNLHGATLDVAG